MTDTETIEKLSRLLLERSKIQESDVRKTIGFQLVILDFLLDNKLKIYDGKEERFLGT